MYYVEKTKGMNYFKQFDYLLFAAVIVLSAIGMIALSSATKSASDSIMLMKQGICLAIGIVFSIILGATDYKDFKTLGIIVYILALVLLVVVIFKGTGKEDLGANSWLILPVIGKFQPSEIAKIAAVVTVSIFLERLKDGQTKKNDILKFVIYSALPVGLVLLQPDFGTAMVFLFMFAMMIFICGIKYKYIFITIGAFLASLPIFWFFILKDFQKNRIFSFLHPEADPLNKGFQVIRSKLAIGSGQIFGKGLYHGIQTQSNGVPIKESDFIFTVIGEELGFIGTMAVVLLIVFILIRCLYISRNSRDSYGSFVVVGLTSMMAFHFIENIGMCIGLTPVTGIPLPFVSQGGSAMITNYVALGIILSVSMRRKRTIFNNIQ